MNKKRVLFVGEYSQVATGFANIARHLLPILHTKYANQFEIAELACYLHSENPAIDLVPWKVYPNQPNPANKAAWEKFMSNPAYEFGQWSFENTLLDFKPHIVVSWRDPWFDEFIHKSPYRRFFKFVHMPTCDGTPQKYEWLDNITKADTVLTYTEWSKNVIEKESQGLCKVFDVATAPIDCEIFKPRNKTEIRKKFGIKENALIFGSVMRNQPRKLFPEIMKGFCRYLDKCKANGRDDLVNNTFLYFHTSYPDMGWDFADEIKRHHLGHKILFTQNCECGAIFGDFFSGDVRPCRNCNQKKAQFPNSGAGIPREILGELYSTFDLLLQISCSEGQGMPVNEAKACGVPVLCTDHTAMIEQAHSPGGIPSKVGIYYQENQSQTGQLRAYANPDDLGDEMYAFAVLPEKDKNQLSKEAHEFVHTNYSADNIASVWARAFDFTDTRDLPSWTGQAKIIQPVTNNIPGNLPATEFVRWCYTHILQDPEGANSVEAMREAKILNTGYQFALDQTGRPARHAISYETYVKHLLQRVQEINQAEIKRVSKVTGSEKQLNIIEV